MCTLTVLRHGDETLVTMTRDEAITRAPETPPQHWPKQTLLAPVDGSAGGTWIAVNAKGQWAALLNGYVPSSNTAESFTTRGGIIPQVLVAKDPLKALKTLDLASYDSFRLWLGDAGSAIQELFWDQQKPHWQTIDLQAAFVSSSSYRQEEVKAYRKAAFEAWLSDGGALLANGLPAIHTYSEQGLETHGVLMRRDTAASKSITQILLSKRRPKMRYWQSGSFNQTPFEIEF